MPPFGVGIDCFARQHDHRSHIAQKRQELPRIRGSVAERIDEQIGAAAHDMAESLAILSVDRQEPGTFDRQVVRNVWRTASYEVDRPSRIEQALGSGTPQDAGASKDDRPSSGILHRGDTPNLESQRRRRVSTPSEYRRSHKSERGTFRT
jgi:hypothetical protein